MATIDSLANETLYDIMEMLKAPSLPLWDMSSSFPPDIYDDLLAAALVCSRWRDPAQRALFDTLLIDDTNHHRNQKFLTSPARPRFRTRSLEVKGGATSWWLDVARATRGLEQLDIRSSEYGSEMTMTWDLFSNSCFTGLKHLSILWPEPFKDPAIPGPILVMPLESLALWLYDVTSTGTSDALLAALFTAASASLKTLHIKSYGRKSESPLATSFPLIAATLRTLILESTRDVLSDHLNLLSACTSLEHLAIQTDECSYDHRTSQPTSPHHIQAIIDALPSPPTLRHLSLDLDKPADLVPIATLLKHPALGLLKKLDLPRMALRNGKIVGWAPQLRGLLRPGGAVSDALLSMKDCCERRGIDCKSGGKFQMLAETLPE